MARLHLLQIQRFVDANVLNSISLIFNFFQAMSKDELYGTLDPNTREWTDGLFTHLLRK